MPRADNLKVKVFQAALFFNSDIDFADVISLQNNVKEFFVGKSYEAISEMKFDNSKNVSENNLLDVPLIQGLFQKEGDENKIQVILGYRRCDIIWSCEPQQDINIGNWEYDKLKDLVLAYFKKMVDFNNDHHTNDPRKIIGFGIVTTVLKDVRDIIGPKDLLNSEMANFNRLETCAVSLGFTKNSGALDFSELLTINLGKERDQDVYVINFDWNNIRYRKNVSEIEIGDIGNILEDYRNKIKDRIIEYV